MAELTKQEFEVLWQIEEGASFDDEIVSLIHIDANKLKSILAKLEKSGLVSLEKKHDEHYKKDNLLIKLNKSVAEEYYKKYSAWIPE